MNTPSQKPRPVAWMAGAIAALFACAVFLFAATPPAQAQLRNPCPADWLADGDCDEPEGLGLCAEGTDPIDCSNPNANYGTGPGYQGGMQSTICPPGYTFSNGFCQPVQQTACPPGQVMMNGSCMPDPCPPGYEFTNGTCQPNPCPQGYVFADGMCQPAGPTGPQPGVTPGQQTGQQPGQQPGQMTGEEPCPPGQVRILGVCQSATGTPIN